MKQIKSLSPFFTKIFLVPSKYFLFPPTSVLTIGKPQDKASKIELQAVTSIKGINNKLDFDKVLLI